MTSRSPVESRWPSGAKIARPSGWAQRIESRIACRYAWPAVSSTPSRASAAAGAISSAHGQRAEAAVRFLEPGDGARGRRTRAAPIRNTWRRAARR